MVTDRANITVGRGAGSIAMKYEVTYGLSVSVFKFDYGPF